MCSSSWDHPPVSNRQSLCLGNTPWASREDAGSRIFWRDGQSCFPSPGDFMRLAYRPITGKQVSGTSTGNESTVP